MKILRTLLLAATIYGCGLALHAAEPTSWTIESMGPGEFEYDINTGVATSTNGVLVRYGGAILTARQVILDQNTGQAVAEGNVTVQRDGQIWAGERLIYNFKSQQLAGSEFRTGQRPFFAAGTTLATVTNGSYVATNAYVTTDDHYPPAHRIRAKHLTIVPGKYIEARHAIIYAGTVPVFYLPYLHKSLERHPNNFAFVPGYRSLFGPYLLSTYNWYWDRQLHGAVHLDLRGKRGVAAGPDFFWNTDRWGDGYLQYYYAHDEDPGIDHFLREIPDNRQRLNLGQKMDLATNLTAMAVVRYQSDPWIVRDFFESEYRDNVQPNTFVEVNKALPNWNLNAYVQPQVNDFQETVERLPDLKLTGLRQQLGVTPLYYESESSAGYYRHVFPDVETNLFYPFRTNAFAATRADTYHQVLLPWTLFGWLNVAPRVGGRLTYYGEADGPGAMTAEEVRGVFNTGMEVNFKASRLWKEAHNDFFEVDGMRHIVEPSINYVFVPTPNARPPELPQFDPRLPSYRLLPIEYPDYNAIDSIDSQNVLRFGLRNRLQTKRDGMIDNLLNWALYTDWRLNPRRGQTTFADVYSDLDLKPRSWMTLSSELRYDVRDGQFREANHTATFQPNQHWSYSVGHRYRDDSREFGIGNNLIISTFYYRFNENWGARISHHFEARDGRMEQQYYTLYRDLRSWTGALTFRYRETRFGPDDYTIALTFSLKAFPRFPPGTDRSRPSSLLGG